MDEAYTPPIEVEIYSIGRRTRCVARHIRVAPYRVLRFVMLASVFCLGYSDVENLSKGELSIALYLRFSGLNGETH